ncbi:DNA polymerase III subunit delta' [Desulfuribacillus alkaliarsenatis]|uniref:DNA polymerase III subunit delta n=1 Tax=Desulfuribacillus alkaliarsenatis TaxID=766136 RepID=A0A1E5FYX6_9FIRM|nr:DNA polymerase III subunit delta' [Desulfuribacillus alkaliarsenatis]OEF95738.1 DNA polymerase III subunit delta' [Desulfuribacillus alkaliarsenatis]
MKVLQRIIESQKIQHAYLFAGPHGSEKDKAALYFAKTLLCANKKPGGCLECIECQRIDNDNQPSLLTIRPDGATIKIQQIKELQKVISYKGITGLYQVYIIEEADKMTVEAANSLLKFLEEPTGNTVAILLSEQPERLLPTIISRCQLVKFSSPSELIIEQELASSGLEPKLAKVASRIWQDANHIVQMAESEKFATIQKIVVQLTEDLLKDKHQYMLLLETEWFSKKPSMSDTEYLVDYMLYWFRDLLLMELGLESKSIFPAEDLKPYRYRFSVDILEKWISDIMKLKVNLRYNINIQLALEAMLLRMQEELMCTG